MRSGENSPVKAAPAPSVHGLARGPRRRAVRPVRRRVDKARERGCVIDDRPTCLLYLLSAGREHELVLRLFGAAPTEDDIVSWMRDGAVQRLHVSRHGEGEAFTFVV